MYTYHQDCPHAWKLNFLSCPKLNKTTEKQRIMDLVNIFISISVYTTKELQIWQIMQISIGNRISLLYLYLHLWRFIVLKSVSEQV